MNAQNFTDGVNAEAARAKRSFPARTNNRTKSIRRPTQKVANRWAFQQLFQKAQREISNPSISITQKMTTAAAVLLCAPPRKMSSAADLMRKSVDRALNEDLARLENLAEAVHVSAALCLAYERMDKIAGGKPNAFGRLFVARAGKLLDKVAAEDLVSAHILAEEMLDRTHEQGPISDLARKRIAWLKSQCRLEVEKAAA